MTSYTSDFCYSKNWLDTDIYKTWEIQHKKMANFLQQTFSCRIFIKMFVAYFSSLDLARNQIALPINLSLMI